VAGQQYEEAISTQIRWHEWLADDLPLLVQPGSECTLLSSGTHCRNLNVRDACKD